MDTVAGRLTANWMWMPDWIDSSAENTAGRIVKFNRTFDLPTAPSRAPISITADTKYKLFVNGTRVALGPSRSSTLMWHYDEIDIAPHLVSGRNVIEVLVLRYFSASRAAMLFARTAFPGLTLDGCLSDSVDLGKPEGWTCVAQDHIKFPTGLIDDVFLHINERVSTEGHTTPGPVKTYGLKTLNGELAPWRLHPRGIALPEYTHTSIEHLMILEGGLPRQDWLEYFQGRSSILLPASSTHTLHVRAEVHSTALLTWAFRASQTSRFHMRITYSEGYEHEPRTYPFFRTKSDRLNPQDMQLIGPYDEIDVDLPPGEVVVYEPFWFRTFRLLKVEIQIDAAEVELMSFAATQMNYPITSVGFIDIPSDAEAKLIWDVSVRTMRNCMLDGYSDCPFYEQLQYIGDSRTVGLFHYLISGDGQLMRKTIASFGASILTEGLPQSRFPSHVPQIIAGFALYWVLQVRDHHLHFGDGPFARSFLPRIDGVLDYFDAHVSSDTGLVVGLHPDLWQFVDWVTAWGATETHPDKGVPVAGRMSNTHTYFSMLYAYTLRQAAMLVAEVGRPALASEYVARADALVQAIRRHCYDGTFFTDSTVSESKGYPYSQHCQAWGVLCGAVRGSDASRIMAHCFLTENDFSKCSYMMMFYAFRAMAAAGDKVYESYWSRAWDPWQRMLANNLTTWEEDDVRQRSDCHAWGSVPLYEYCTELAGIHILSPGSKKIHFKPRIRLAPVVRARVALGDDNHATVEWLRDGSITKINLRLRHPIEIISQIPDRMTDHGVTDQVTLEYAWSKD